MNVRKSLGLKVFLPRLHFKRSTRRGVIKVTEPLFPCYIFVQSPLDSKLDEIRYTAGISSLVHFGDKIPTVPDYAVAELQKYFEAEEPVVLPDQLSTGSEVRVVNGAFAHLNGVVLKSMPAKSRVQVLIEILGRSTIVEFDQNSLLREKCSIAALLPSLAA